MMHLVEKMCGLCAGDLDVSMSLANYEDLVEITKLITNLVSERFLFIVA